MKTIYHQCFQGHRQDFAWVGASTGSMSIYGGIDLGVYFPGKLSKIKFLESTFLHSERHFNPPSQIKRTFAARLGHRHTHHTPPAYGPGFLN